MDEAGIRNQKILASQDGSELQVAAVTYLRPCDNVVRVKIPLAAADSYSVYLPQVASCPGAEFTIVGYRATGSYVDGEVAVKDLGDGAGGAVTTDGLSADGDRLHLKNCGGKFYATLADVTT